MNHDLEPISPHEAMVVRKLKEQGRYNGTLKALHLEFRRLEQEHVNLCEQHSLMDDRVGAALQAEDAAYEAFTLAARPLQL